jgi:hypothetical protein
MVMNHHRRSHRHCHRQSSCHSYEIIIGMTTVSTSINVFVISKNVASMAVSHLWIALNTSRSARRHIQKEKAILVAFYKTHCNILFGLGYSSIFTRITRRSANLFLGNLIIIMPFNHDGGKGRGCHKTMMVVYKNLNY